MSFRLFRKFDTTDRTFRSGWILALMGLSICVFSIVIRSFWIINSGDHPLYRWNDELSITTNDAYHYAASLRKEVEGAIHNNREVKSTNFDSRNGGIVITGYAIHKLTGLKIETITYYTPIILSGLFGVTILLIGNILGYPIVGFLGGLIAVSSKIFFIRTRGGYFDTDIYASLAPILLVYFLLRVINSGNHLNTIWVSILLMVQDIFYTNNSLISGSVIFMYIVFSAKWNINSKHIIGSMLIMAPALIGNEFEVPISIRIALIFGAFLYVRKDGPSIEEMKKVCLVSLIAVIPLTTLFHRGWGKFTAYFAPTPSLTYTDHISFSYTSFLSIVEEAKAVSPSIFSELVSISPWTIGASFVGLILLVADRREAILLTPLALIGSSAFFTGERFTLYAVAPLSVGLTYFLFRIGSTINNKHLKETIPWVLSMPILYSNTMFAYGYEAAPVVLNDEALVLDTLGTISSPHDRVVAWWDYGYPIEYYSGRNAIASGSASAQLMYILSSILSSSSQEITTNLSKAIITLGPDKIEHRMKMNIQEKKYIFDQIKGNSKDQKQLTNIYIYLPYRMLGIFSQIYSIGNRDIVQGTQNQHVLYLAENAQKNGNLWEIDRKLKIDLSTGKATMDKTLLSISKYIEITYSDKGPPIKYIKEYANDSNLIYLYLKSHNKAIIMDDNIFQSFFIQAFFFENYDKTLMDLSIRNKYSLVYRLKKATTK